MKAGLPFFIESLAQLFFPVYCPACGTDQIKPGAGICALCRDRLPLTGFEKFADNPVEKIFWGRLNLAAASSQYYFTKSSILQQLLHQLKYRGKKEIGRWLGQHMGNSIRNSGRFLSVDAIVPLPLHPRRQRLRGYNQAEWISRGLADKLERPVINNVLFRHSASTSQTRQNRTGRWQNVKDRFHCQNAGLLQNRHVLLVDDVITTGATLEAAGRLLIQIPGLELSVASLAYTAL